MVVPGQKRVPGDSWTVNALRRITFSLVKKGGWSSSMPCCNFSRARVALHWAVTQWRMTIQKPARPPSHHLEKGRKCR